MSENAFPGPVVVGAVGGSGTRVVARILMDLGLHLGSDLNESLDNLWFTLLFKRPRWHAKVARRDPEILRTGFAILEKALLGEGRWSRAERAFVARAVLDLGIHGWDHRGRGRGIWPLVRLLRMIRARPLDRSRYRGWGWKEPNSYLFVESLSRSFERPKFVYVIRHGLDMAYGRNEASFFNWAPHFGIDPRAGGSRPDAMLRYWVRASEKAIEDGRKFLGEDFLLLSFDALCVRARDTIEGLLRFLGRDPAKEDVEGLAGRVRVPPSMGRYRQEDWRALDPASVAAVKALGFDTD
jgi:hypothetical protein